MQKSVEKSIERNFRDRLNKSSVKIRLPAEQRKESRRVVTALAGALSTNQKCKTLDLAYNNIEDHGFFEICNALKRNTTLVSLDLSMNAISMKLRATPKERKKVGVRKAGPNKPTMIDLRARRKQNKTDKAVKANVKAPSYNGQYDSKNLGDTLGEALMVNKSLQELNLSRNSVRTNGLFAIMNGLSASTSLVTVDISGNRFGSQSATAVGKFLKRNKSVLELNISSAGLTDKGIERIWIGFSQGEPTREEETGEDQHSTSVLRYLNLGNNKLSDDCLKYLGGLVSRMSYLRQLLLRNNHICAIPEEIIRCLLLKHNLKSLDLGCTDLNEETLCNVFEAAGEKEAVIEELILDQLYTVNMSKISILNSFKRAAQENPALSNVCVLKTPGSHLVQVKEILKGILLNKELFVEITPDERVVVNEEHLFSNIHTDIGQLAFIENLKKLELQLVQSRMDLIEFKHKVGSALSKAKHMGRGIVTVSFDSLRETPFARKTFRNFMHALERYDFDFADDLEVLSSSDEPLLRTVAQKHMKKRTSKARRSEFRSSSVRFMNENDSSLNLISADFTVDDSSAPIYESEDTLIVPAVDLEVSIEGDSAVMKVFKGNKSKRVTRWEKELYTRELLRNKNDASFYNKNIVDVVEYSKEGSKPFVVLKECADRSLWQRLRISKDPLELDTIKTYGRQMSLILRCFFKAECAHMDFTPENLLLLETNLPQKSLKPAPSMRINIFQSKIMQRQNKEKRTTRLKAIDFDSVKVYGEKINLRNLSSLSVTRAYMAPELFALYHPDELLVEDPQVMISDKQDVWSFGVIMYEMLTGRTLFDDESRELHNTAAQSRLKQFKGLTKRNLDLVLRHCKDKVQVELAKDLLTQCLRRDPNERISVAQLGRHEFLRPLRRDDTQEMDRPKKGGFMRSLVSTNLRRSFRTGKKSRRDL